MTNIDNSVMDWNDVIEDDGQEYVLLLKRIITSLLLILKEEDSLVVQKFLLQIKKQNQFKFFSEMGVASMKFDLILSKSLTWKVSAFFRSIGQKKRGKKTLRIGIKFLVQKVELTSNKRYTQTNLVKKKYQWSRLLHWLRWEIF